jgi:NAD(P)-dependent dehydrogenase (short-subunit alcohol dehydrogenase family)
VTAAGGVGIAVQVDHLEADQVAALADWIRRSYGRLDLLVNDIWGAERLKGAPSEWNTPIWQFDLQTGLRILRLAVETHLITSHHLLPLLVGRPGGLVVEVTDGTTDYNASRYRLSVYYDLAKTAVNRLAFSQGHELAGVGGTAVAITPGFLRSEMMLDGFGVTERTWRNSLDASRSRRGLPVAPAEFALSESPLFIGRAVAAVAADPDRTRWNQQSVTSGRLAAEYGLVDGDGTRPDIWRYFDEVLAAGGSGSPEDYRWP